MHHCVTDVGARSARSEIEIRITWAGIVVTGLCALLVLGHAAEEMRRSLLVSAYFDVARESLLLTVVVFLIYGSLVYQLSRRGYFFRLARHRPPSLREAWKRLERTAPPVTILVPSYKEEARVVRASLLSAALQHYPRRRVVLLIDDPPTAATAEDGKSIAEARDLPRQVMDSLKPARRKFAAAFADARSRLATAPFQSRREGEVLAILYADAVQWFEEQAATYPVTDHAEALFVQTTFRDRARYFRDQAEVLRYRARSESELSRARVLRGYRELATVFDVEVTSFERKRYENLSHAPNKAMNLNSYIAVAGTRVRERLEEEGKLFLDLDAENGDEIPEPKYFVTLDADSVLAPDYVLRLVEVMERPQSERIGVIQTPYSAFPGAPGLLERVAGATTDIQHIIHQGFSAHDATYWVGANAVLRTEALRDIAVEGTERGFPVVRYIQDRTVIEDTESSIDLLRRGWTLHNYPERLSYSATPPDFGALLIQRRRWANGGLLIVPKLVRYVLHVLRHTTGLSRRLLAETFLRLHYLVSLASVNIGLLLLFSVPTPDGFFTLWLPLSAVPYYVLYGRDLVQAGYRFTDLLRVYALNLLLVPVHLGGVMRSIEQAWTGRQIPFHRTPKVLDRTTAPVGYIVAEIMLLLLMVLSGAFHLAAGRWLNAALGFVNAGVLLYAMGTMMQSPATLAGHAGRDGADDARRPAISPRTAMALVSARTEDRVLAE